LSRIGAFLVQRLSVRENQVYLMLVLAVGVIAGLSAVLFTLCIEFTQQALFGAEPSRLRLVLVPTGVSLLTGFLLAKYFPNARGSGIPQTKVAYHLGQGLIPARVPFGKFLTGVLCVGSGHSMGREGPSVQIGAGLASIAGRWFRLSPSKVRDLVPVGAAAALAAAFNTPVSAVLFALEEVVGDMNAGLLGSTVLASVSAVVVERSILGNSPLFHLPPYRFVQPADLIGYAVLGVAGGFISVVFCKFLLGLRLLFRRLPRSTEIFQPAMGGLAIGLILVFVPQVMGVGYQYVDQALNGSLPLKVLALLLVVKLVATVVSYSSGNAGGIFAPSLFLGAMAGGAVGHMMSRFGEFHGNDPGAYALVGMGVLFAGIIRAPMTSVFMIFELTQNYEILVPLMIANMLSFLISQRFQREPIYHALLHQDHIHLPGPESNTATANLRARDVMATGVNLISPRMSAQEFWASMKDKARDTDFFIVGDGAAVQGTVSYSKIEQAVNGGKGHEPIASLTVSEGWPYVYPDHPMSIVLERLGQGSGVVPVLSRTGYRQLEGIITQKTFLELFQKFEARRAGSANANTAEL
jgi:CIC family chloride channel protein